MEENNKFERLMAMTEEVMMYWMRQHRKKITVHPQEVRSKMKNILRDRRRRRVPIKRLQSSSQWSQRKWWLSLFADLLGGPAKAAMEDFEMTYWGSESEKEEESESEEENEEEKEEYELTPPAKLSPVPFAHSIRKFAVNTK